MSNETNRYSKGGQPILKHERGRDQYVGFEYIPLKENDTSHMQEVIEHFEKHIGKVAYTFHESYPDTVSINVHVIEPTPERDFYTLFTTGMSELPMNVAEEVGETEKFQYGELMICLPKTWNVEDLENPKNYWPMAWLKLLAKLPHTYDTWLGFGHTIPNGQTAEPIVENTKLCCMMIAVPVLIEDLDSFTKLKTEDGKMINIYSVLPIYKEEMNFKLNNSAYDLLDKFDKYGYNEYLIIDRKNTCKKRFLFF